MNAKSPLPGDPINRREFLSETAVVTAGLAVGAHALGAAEPGAKPLNYNPDMEYRPLGRTGMKISAVCLGGHWKRIDTVVAGGGGIDSPDFQKNRYDVVTRCIERGINYIDACTGTEVMAYTQALKGRRDKMHLGFSWFEEEMRNSACRTCNRLLETLEKGLKQSGLEYVDLWRVTCTSKAASTPRPRWRR